ncbi:transposase [Anaeromyxobacter paludicola]|uniref:Transposase IS200-like domain-containing protein n=1 Tax=Anaeromyxobacter paludicola TaxID=2918171 RepID=A0ABM7XBJ3_9BACT|nr:transposase [Anaeromyxobacter paludicola]BDG09230.1 hypothetical protein AMPC_23430 [Anaeromyxobacter paludicola]
MTAPRQVLPGTTYLVTRRCSERRFFLRPSPLTNAIFLYVLAVAARLYGVRLHAFCVLSNHYHLVLTDPHARLPAFMQYLDGLVARAVNAALGRWEGFWSAEASYNAVSQADSDDVVRKIAYVLANPVSAGLVRSGRDWPGLWSSPEQLGTATLTAARPKVFFHPCGALPESVSLQLTLPPGFSCPEELRARVESAMTELPERRRTEGKVRGFLGRAAVLAQSPFGRPGTGEPRRKLSPRFAAADPVKRVEAISRWRTFLDGYRRALASWRSGVRNVLFPPGTYQLRLEHRAPCAAPG